MNIIAKYIHGSGDSIDVDTYYVVDHIPPFQEAKQWCDAIKEENANLITIEDGIVTGCYKGTPDECNNSLYDTYGLHEQEYPLLVERKVERDKGLKYIRAIRIILSHISRSQYRQEVKAALKSDKLSDKARVLHNINFKTIDYDKMSGTASGKDILKVIAFQLGQVIGLQHDIELYTKADVAKQYWDLQPFLYRADKVNLYTLTNHIEDFCQYLISIIDDEHDGLVTFVDGQTYNVLHEKRIDNE